MRDEDKQNQSLVNLQKKLLEMFKWFHAFCVENNLRYYALGGTMLGAVRHNGFIPWDDDIDVGMPRKDYQRFNELCKKKKFEKYIVETVSTKKKDYFYGYTKIYDTSTTLIEKARKNVIRGIYVDVFPLDGIANDRSEITSYYNPIYRKYQLLVARTCALSKRRALYKNIVIVLARCIPESLLNNKKLLLEIDYLCQQRDFDAYRYVGNILGNWGIKETMPREYMGIPQLYRFEDTLIYGVEDYDAYLSCLYGNWEELPPEEKRVTHHDYICLNLYKSYME